MIWRKRVLGLGTMTGGYCFTKRGRWLCKKVFNFRLPIFSKKGVQPRLAGYVWEKSKPRSAPVRARVHCTLVYGTHPSIGSREVFCARLMQQGQPFGGRSHCGGHLGAHMCADNPFGGMATRRGSGPRLGGIERAEARGGVGGVFGCEGVY
jgi:hypothetical protein